MIVDKIERHEFKNYGLGGHDPPGETVSALREVNKNLELIWNQDDSRWEIYLSRGDTLYWQNSAPVTGLTITPGLKTWLQKFDSSKGGKLDQEDREKRYLESLYAGFDKLAKRRLVEKEETKREVSSVCKSAMGYMDNAKGNRIVVPGPVVGMMNGKPLRLIKKG
jgi:ribosomal protein S20